jgi:Fe-S oxidoreductase
VSAVDAGDRGGAERADLLRCVHCGLCLTSCPTYRETKLETESPRGRIYLMRAMDEGRLEPSRAVAAHFDLCLNCRACETACPAGVHYGLLLEKTRAKLAVELPPTRGERVRNLLLDYVFPHPARMRLLTSLVAWSHRAGLSRLAAGALGGLLPEFARAGAALRPDDAQMDGAAVEPGVYPPYAPRADGTSPRVGWFRTCMMPGFFPAADRAAVHLLREAGATVVIPPRQNCCGALLAHAGRREGARRLARENVVVFADAGPLDWIATDAAGCGATLREYGDLFRGGPTADANAARAADAFAASVRDVTEVLVELGLPAPRAEVNETVGVHDACHLAHAQKVRSAPRLLLKALPGVTVVDLPHSDRCCGSAGIYNLQQPEMADRLLAQKMDAVAAVAPTVVAVGNPGCLLQMQKGARERGMAAPMRHPVEIVARAYPRPGTGATGA